MNPRHQMLAFRSSTILKIKESEIGEVKESFEGAKVFMKDGNTFQISYETWFLGKYAS